MADLTLINDPLETEDAIPEIDEEVDEVLTALRRLRDRASSPVVRACLEAARADIVHLTSSDRRVAADSPRRPAACPPRAAPRPTTPRRHDRGEGLFISAGRGYTRPIPLPCPGRACDALSVHPLGL